MGWGWGVDQWQSTEYSVQGSKLQYGVYIDTYGVDGLAITRKTGTTVQVSSWFHVTSRLIETVSLCPFRTRNASNQSAVLPKLRYYCQQNKEKKEKSILPDKGACSPRHPRLLLLYSSFFFFNFIFNYYI